MANLADNKFYLCVKDGYDISSIIKQINNLFENHLEGEIDLSSNTFIEGWFISKWSFPHKLWEEILENKPIYFRCLTEEYGMGLVSMNIHNEDGTWREPQYFDI